MSPQELAELDLAVARVEGRRNPRLEEETPFSEVMCMIDVEEDDIAAAVDFDISRKVIYQDEYKPTRDAQEAMRLMVKYELYLGPWKGRWWACRNASLTKYGDDTSGETPCIAICKAVCQLGGRK